MVVFRCVKELPGLGNFFSEEYWELSQDEIEEAHSVESFYFACRPSCLKASKAWMLAQVGEEEAARLIFQDIESDRVPRKPCFSSRRAFSVKWISVNRCNCRIWTGA